MGYDTTFSGSFTFNRPVDKQLRNYVNDFSNTRHMKRDNRKIMAHYPDWQEMCFNGELGGGGEYFIAPYEMFDAFPYGDKSILDINKPPASQPGLYCQWVVENDGAELVWDGGEKFYNYVEWLEYLISHFFAPCGYVLNGTVMFDGEDSFDCGAITVTDNVVKTEYMLLPSQLTDKQLLDEVVQRGLFGLPAD